MEEKFIKLCNISNCYDLDDYQSLKISEDIKYLLKQQLNGQAVLYYLSRNNEYTEDPVWGSSNVNSCIFSDEGNELVVVSKENSCKIFKLLEASIIFLREITRDEFSLILGELDIDLTSKSDMKVYKYNKKSVLLFLNNTWLITLIWNGEVLLATNKIEVASCITINVGHSAVYTLTAGGNVSAYDQNNGEKLGVVHLYAMVPPHRAMDVLGFKHLSVSIDGTYLAVSDRASQVFLVKLKNAFTNDGIQEHLKWNCGASAISYGSDTSQVTAVSRIQPKILPDTISMTSSVLQVPVANRSYRDTWNSYLQSLYKSSYEDSSEEQNCKMHKMPDPPSGLMVRGLQLGNGELSVWYTEPDSLSGGVYYLHDLTSHTFIEQPIPHDSIVIPGGLAGLKDAFLSPRGLYMFLGTISHDLLVSKMLHCMERESLSRLLHWETWANLMVPLPAVVSALEQEQLDVVQLALNLHVHGLRITFTNIAEYGEKSWKDKLRKLMSDLDQLLDVIQQTCITYSRKPVVREQLIATTLEQINRLLEFLSNIQNGIAQEFIQKIMQHVIQLRKYLLGQSIVKVNDLEDPLCPKHLLEEWQKWSHMTDEAVIRDAVMKKCIPLSQVFLIQVRLWSKETFQSRYHGYLDKWISLLLDESNVEHAEMILWRAGKDPDKTLSEMCVRTDQPKLRNLLAQHLIQKDTLPTVEKEALNFLKLIEEILAKVDFYKLWKREDSKDGGLNDIQMSDKNIPLSAVLHQSDEWRQYVLISLFFNIPGANHLESMLQPEFVWIYLLENNCEDLLCTWISCVFSQCAWETIPSCVEKWVEKLMAIPKVHNTESSKNISSEYLLTVFTKWPITQNMVDAVTSANAMPTLKELILNHLSRYGVFCSNEMDDIRAILQRVIVTGNMNTFKNVFCQKSANVSYEDFKMLFTIFLIKHNIPEIAFPCLEDFDYTKEEVDTLCGCVASRDDWFLLWLAFRDMKRNPNDHETIYKAILKTVQYLSNGNEEYYLKNHPLVVLAMLIFTGQSLADVFTSDDGVANLNGDILSATLNHYPMLKRAVSHIKNPHLEIADITLYQLLEGNTPFDVSKLFGWQESHRIEGEEFPSFTSPRLVEKYGIEYKMNYLIYLKLARPYFAVCRFVIDQYKTYATLSQKRIQDAVNTAHGLALQYFNDMEITASCLAFTEIMGEDSSKLKVDLCSIRRVYKYIQNNKEDLSPFESFGELVYELRQCNANASTKILAILEKALCNELIHTRSCGKEMVEEIALWGIAVKFARLHGLNAPEVFLRQLAAENNLLIFMVFIEIYRYPLEQVKYLSTSFESLILQEHLFHILQVEVNGVKQNEPQLVPRDARKTLYSKTLSKKSKFKQDEMVSVGRSKKNSKRQRDTLQAVTENIKQQKSITEKILNMATSLSSGSSSEDAAGKSLISYDVWGVDEKDDLFLLLLNCHNASDPLQSLLQATYTYQNPTLAVLATFYDPRMDVPCFCAWLTVSLPPSNSEKLLEELGRTSNHLMWSGEDVLRILQEAVSCKFIRTIQLGCFIFFPDNPLNDLMNFLFEAIIMKDFDECLLKMKIFKATYVNLKNNDKEGTVHFISDHQWLGCVAVELCKVALCSSLTSIQYTLEFLAVICEGTFLEDLPEPLPDFAVVESLVKSLSLTGVFPKMEFLLYPANSIEHKKEVNRCLQELMESKQFSCALQFAAAANLNRNPVLMAQWSDKFEKTSKKSLGRDYVGFWKKCDDAFHAEEVNSHIASEFFQIHADKLLDIEEKFRVLQLAVAWLQKAVLTSTDSTDVDTLEFELVSVELSMWNCWLQAPTEISIMLDHVEPDVLYSSKSRILKMAGITKLPITTTCSEEEQLKVHNLVNKLLDKGKIVSACRVEAMYGIEHQDLSIILLCLGLAEGTVSPYELTAEQRLLFSDTSSTRILSHRRRTMLSSISALSQNPGANSLLEEYVEIPPRDRQDTLTSLEKLTGRLKHGVAIGNRIVMCYRVAMNLDMDYLNVLLMREPLNLLKTALADDCLNKFIVASDIIMAAQINSSEVAEFMAGEILEAVTKSKLKGEILGTMMWGIDLELCFHLVLDVCRDQVVLGNKLLSLVPKTISSKVHEFHDAYGVAVELIIHAHNCFVAALSMEGIGSVLKMCQTLTKKLRKKDEWALMVRLLTGVERYTEMSYILKILYKQEHFEFLLAKGLDKVKGLKLAIIDFLKKYHPEDRKLYEMVTLRFNMFEEVAKLWEDDGVAQEDALMKFVLKDPQNDRRYLPNTDDAQMLLLRIMECFKQAAEFFLKGEKLNRGVELVHKAQLVALQRYFISTVPVGHNSPLLLRLSSNEITNLVTHLLTFPQAFLVVRAYEHNVDWAAALYQHCVLDGDESYFTSFTSSIPLNSSLVECIVLRYQVNKNVTADSRRMMKKFIQLIDSIELKYRLASQLDFRDLIESLLDGPEEDVAYLKDTVWKHGFRY